MSESFLSDSIEVFQQPDKPPTCGSQKIMYAMERRCRPDLSTACIISFFLSFFFFFFFETKELLSQFIGYYAGRGHPQYNEGDLTVSLATARHVEVRQLGLRSQGVNFFR